MSNRHLARTIAMQTLYQWDFLGKPAEKIDEILIDNLHEFAPDFDDKGFIRELIDGVVDNQAKIDSLITTYAPEWPI